jgi:Large eukaryotic DNA virus major capsid protein/Major capsid protein N-terminus
MSGGGKFLLILNQGTQDQLLNALSLLQDRINKYIDQENKKYTEAQLIALPDNEFLKIGDSVLPNLRMIEQTHVILTNGHHKPFVPTTMEYIKLHTSSTYDFGKKIIFQPTQVGNFINDIVLHVKISGLKAVNARDRVRYVAFPGHKLIEKAQFLVNSGTVIDEINTEDYNNYYLYELNTAEKKKNWCKNVGQELPKLGYLTSDPAYDMQREYRWIGDGFQTLKYSQDTLEMFIPMLFWCKDLKSSIPSHIIPWGQMQIQITFTDIANLIGFADYGGGGSYVAPKLDVCELYVNNIFTSEEIYNIYTKKFVFSLIRVHQHHTETIKHSIAGGEKFHLQQLKFPLENLFVSFRPQENVNNSQFWYKSAQLVEKTYKVPVVAVNTANTISGTISSVVDSTVTVVASGLSTTNNFYEGYEFVITSGGGYNNNNLLQNRYTVASYIAASNQITIDETFYGDVDSTSTFELFLPQLAINTVTYYDENPTVDTISLRASDVKIWDDHSESFYNSYLPLRFGGLMGMPEDNGTYFIPFNFYPLAYQPTGSYNSSRGRELYLFATSSVISASYPVELIVSARAINFLYVNNGAMTLKYLT